MTVSLILAVVFAALTAVFGWLGARAPDLHRGPRMVPYRFLMVGCAATAVVMLVHVVNLLGVSTGSGRAY